MTTFLHRSDIGFIKVSATEFSYKRKIIFRDTADNLPMEVVPVVWAVPLGFSREWEGYASDNNTDTCIFLEVNNMASVYAGMHSCKYTAVYAKDAETHLNHLKLINGPENLSEEDGRCFEVAIPVGSISNPEIAQAVATMWRYRSLIGRLDGIDAAFYDDGSDLDYMVFLTPEGEEVKIKKLEFLDYLETYLTEYDKALVE